MTHSGPRQIKICGLCRAADLSDALRADVSYTGIVHYQGSPRHVGFEAMADLLRRADPRRAVLLLADPDDATIAAAMRIIPWRAIQCHGQESPARISAIKARWPEVEIWKAIQTGCVEDVHAGLVYRDHAAKILFDARPEVSAGRPGGHGRPFDWTLLAGVMPPDRWMLAGGLTAANVGDAIRITGAPAVDVSTGVETSPGVKDKAKMRAFVTSARGKGALVRGVFRVLSGKTNAR